MRCASLPAADRRRSRRRTGATVQARLHAPAADARAGPAVGRRRAGGVPRSASVGYVLAAELRAHGVDFSFTPVLDLDHGRSGVIGDRALHSDPRVVTMLASHLMHGLQLAGMANCGKHYPGHGWAEADSHVDMPHDTRSRSTILDADAAPYRWLGRQLTSVMPAHVIYDAVDSAPAGFSARWIEPAAEPTRVHRCGLQRRPADGGCERAGHHARPRRCGTEGRLRPGARVQPHRCDGRSARWPRVEGRPPLSRADRSTRAPGIGAWTGGAPRKRGLPGGLARCQKGWPMPSAWFPRIT